LCYLGHVGHNTHTAKLTGDILHSVQATGAIMTPKADNNLSNVRNGWVKLHRNLFTIPGGILAGCQPLKKVTDLKSKIISLLETLKASASPDLSKLCRIATQQLVNYNSEVDRLQEQRRQDTAYKDTRERAMLQVQQELGAIPIGVTGSANAGSAMQHSTNLCLGEPALASFTTMKYHKGGTHSTPLIMLDGASDDGLPDEQTSTSKVRKIVEKLEVNAKHELLKTHDQLGNLSSQLTELGKKLTEDSDEKKKEDLKATVQLVCGEITPKLDLVAKGFQNVADSMHAKELRESAVMLREMGRNDDADKVMDEYMKLVCPSKDKENNK